MRMLNVLLAFVFCAGIACADSVTLKSGSIMKGRIVSENATSIQLEPAGAAEGSSMELPKDSVVSITRVTGSKIIVQQLQAPTACPAAQAVQNSAAAQPPAAVASVPTNPLTAAERYAAAKRFEQAVEIIAGLYVSTNASLADLQKAKSLQEEYFSSWLASLNLESNLSGAKVDTLRNKITTLTAKITTAQQRDDANKSAPVARRYHYDGAGHLVNDYPYYYYRDSGPRYVAMGASSELMAAKSEIQKAEKELELEQQNQISIKGKIDGVTNLQTRHLALATNAISQREAEQAKLAEAVRQAELAKQAEQAKQAEEIASAIAQNSPATESAKVTVPITAPQSSPAPEDTNKTWLDRNWKWLLVGLGVIVVAKSVGIIKFG